MKNLLTLALACLLSATAYSQTKITGAEISKHIGDSVTVIDKVYGNKVLDNGTILLNLGAQYPNQLLVVVIDNNLLLKADFKPQTFTGKQVMATGKVFEYNGKPQIVLSSLNQLQSVPFTDSVIKQSF